MKDYFFVDVSYRNLNATNADMIEQGWEFHSMTSHREYGVMMCFQRDHADERERFEE